MAGNIYRAVEIEHSAGRRIEAGDRAAAAKLFREAAEEFKKDEYWLAHARSGAKPDAENTVVNAVHRCEQKAKELEAGR